MIVYVNGKEEQWQATQSLAAWLHSQGMQGQRLAIEVNGNIVPKSRFSEYTVQESDRIEVIIAVGGG